MVRKPPQLYLVRGSGTAERKILKFPVLCRYERVELLGPLGRPWPQQHAWRDRVRMLTQHPVHPEKH